MNWRRGFFRAWCVVAVLWLLLIGAVSWTSIASPYPEQPVISASADGHLTSVAAYSDEFNELRKQSEAGDLTDSFMQVDGVSVELFEPKLQVLVGGKMVKLDAKYARLSPDERQKTLDKISRAIANATSQGASADASVLQNLREVLSTGLAAARPVSLANVTSLGDSLIARSISDRRSSAIVTTFAIAFVPPIVLLLLGSALAWVLTGFRRATA